MTRSQIPRFFLVLLAAGLLLGCGQSAEPPAKAQPRPVRTLLIDEPRDADWREFSGVVEAASKADLSFSVGGRLQQLLVKEGERVEQDQLLAQLDDRDLRIQRDSRQAEFNKADADLKRAEKLRETGSISRSDYDQLVVQRETASNTLAAAEQNVAYAQLHAPFAGRIALRHVENYEEVRANQPIFTLQDPSAIAIRIDIPESVMILSREGAQPEVYAIFSQFPERSFPLTVREVSTQADAQTNTYAVRFDMPKVADLNILPGMSVTVRGRPEEGLRTRILGVRVPAHAVLEDSSGRFAWVVKRLGDQRGVIEKRSVQIGELSDAGLMVTEGLQPGDELVTAGMSKMSQGLEVRLPPGDPPQ